MPRGSSAYTTEAAKNAITTAWLVAIPSLPKINDASTTIALYFTDWHENITLGGQTYIPSPLAIEMPKISKDMEKASGTAALCNLTNAFSGYAKEYQIRDTEVTVIHAVLSPSGWIGATSFVGIMDAPSITETQITVSISNGRSVATLIPRRLYWSRDFPHLPSSKDPRELVTK